MKYSLLIHAGDPASRLTITNNILEKFIGRVTQPHPDIINLSTQGSLGINQIRQLQKQLAYKPFQFKNKIAIIHQAHLLTHEAQNALLKTLEEPPDRTKLILLAQNINHLLPTIISRCRVIFLPEQPLKSQKTSGQADDKKLLHRLCHSTPGQRINLLENYTDRSGTLELIDQLLNDWRQILRAGCGLPNNLNKPIKITRNRVIRALSVTLKTRYLIENNVNPRLALDNLVLSFPTAGD